MGVAFYIALDIDEPDFDVDVDGKIVARYEERLSELAGDADMPGLPAFFGMGGDEIGDVLGEDDITGDSEWHDANDGATYFERLAELTATTDLPRDVTDELCEFASILRQAAAVGARWHLAIDV